MANIFQTFTRARASADRINEVLNSNEVISDGALDILPERRGEIEFCNVSFAYASSPDHPVLSNVSFRVRPGETFAIIGATGSGKSSLVNLIPRFYDATCGEVLVDGVNVKDYKTGELRDRIAIVLQRAELYQRSIADNIKWGRRDADPWDIKTAAEIAQADGFICNTEYGYNTVVTEDGHSLSGGQKQRISIARAVIKKCNIIIFDDATSALDLHTEAELYRALGVRMGDITKIIIAQRIASVKSADRIAVLNGGRLEALGSHEELMKSSELYRDIYSSQLKEGGEINGGE